MSEAVFRKPLKVQVVPDALVVGFGEGAARGIARPAAVFDANGVPVARAVCRRDSRLKVTSTPPLPEGPGEPLAGTWLFGGMLYAHFGHFLCESTARLWALEGAEVDGVLFYPKRQSTWPKKFLAPVLPWLAVAGVKVPVRLASDPVRVERLLVPDQGFGTGDMIGGAPEYRGYAARHFGAGIAAKGAARIYISRTQLFSKRGRILGEAHLEALLAAEGYTIYHPQEHPIEDQIAQYKAARVVISTDCSALHLAACFAKPSDRVAIIQRRPGGAIDDFLTQYRSFAGLEPVVANCLGWVHLPEGTKPGPMNEVYCEVDFAALHRVLMAEGLVNGAPWASPAPAAIAAELADLGTRIGAAILPIEASA